MQKIVEERDEVTQQSAAKDNKIKNLMLTNLELQGQLTSLNQLVSIKDDLSEQMDQLNNYIEEL